MHFSYNGVKNKYVRILRGLIRPPWSRLSRLHTQVPGRAGALFDSTQIEVRKIDVPIRLQSNSFYDLQKLKEELAEWLVTDKPAPLIFDDEINRVYYAIVDGGLDLDEILNSGKGVITFICMDPFKYGHTVRASLDPQLPVILVNEGTAPCKPVFSFDVLQPLTHISLIKDDEYMAIGEPSTTEETTYEPRTRLIYDDAETTVGWGGAAFQPDNGARQGTMVSNGYEFIAGNYGTGTAWHGPIIQKSFNPTQDFFIRAYFDVRMSNGKQRGRSEIYLLGENNTILFKLLVVCNDSTGRGDIDVQLRRPGKTVFLVNENKKYNKGFYGYVDLKREGNKFTSEVGVQDTSGNVIRKEYYSYTDLNNDFQAPISITAVAVAKWGNNDDPYKASIRFIRVERINPPAGIPYIAHPGDVIEIDHKKEVILINGDPRTDLKDFGGEYFALSPGETVLVIEPQDAVVGEVEWRDSYK